MKFICTFILSSMIGTLAYAQGGVEIFTENGKTGARHYGDVLYEANYDEIISLGGCDEYYFALREGDKWTIMYGDKICGSGTYSSIYKLDKLTGKKSGYHAANLAIAEGKDGKDLFDLSSCLTDIKINTTPITRIDHYNINEDWLVIGYKEQNGHYKVGQLYDGPYNLLNSFVKLDSIAPVTNMAYEMGNEELMMLYKTYLDGQIGLHSLSLGEEYAPIKYTDIQLYIRNPRDYEEHQWIKLISEKGVQLFNIYDRFSIPGHPVQDVMIDEEMGSIAIKNNDKWQIKTMSSDNYFMIRKEDEFCYPEYGFDVWHFDDVKPSNGYASGALYWVSKWDNWYLFDGFQGFLSQAYKKPLTKASYKKLNKIMLKFRKKTEKKFNQDESNDIVDYGEGPFGIYSMIADGFLPQIADKVEHVAPFLSVYHVGDKIGLISSENITEPIYDTYEIAGGKYSPVVSAQRQGKTYLYYDGLELPWPVQDYKVEHQFIAYKADGKWGAMELTFENKILKPQYDSVHISKIGPIVWQNNVCTYLSRSQELKNKGVEWVYGSPDSSTVYFKAVNHALQSYNKWYVFSDKYNDPKMHAIDVDGLDDKTWRAYNNFINRENVSQLKDDIYFQEGKISGIYELDKEAIYAGHGVPKALYKGAILEPKVVGNHNGVIAIEFKSNDGYGILSTAWDSRDFSFITMDFDKVDYSADKQMWVISKDGKQAGFSVYRFNRDLDNLKWYDSVELENEFGWLKGSNGDQKYLTSPNDNHEFGPYEDVAYLKKNYQGIFYCFKDKGMWGVKKVTKNGEVSIEVDATHKDKDSANKAL